MTILDYKQSLNLAIQEPTFAGLIMAAIREADTDNLEKIKQAFPDIYQEFIKRYNAPGGALNDRELAFVIQENYDRAYHDLERLGNYDPKTEVPSSVE